MLKYIRYLYVKYKPWPKSTRDIRRWSRWTVNKQTRRELMQNGWKE